MFRVLAITPIHVEVEELRRRQHRYDCLAPEGVAVRLVDLGESPDVPRSLETPEDLRRSEALMIERLAAADPDECDAVMPDCVLDPGVHRRGSGPVGRVPVVGVLDTCLHLLAGTRTPFGAVARNAAIAAELTRKVVEYGYEDSFGGTDVLGLPFDAIADTTAWRAAVVQATTSMRVSVVVNGCSAVEVEDLPGDLVLVDPTAVALGQLGLAHSLGLAPAT